MIKGVEFAECGHRESRWLCEDCLADQVDLYATEAATAKREVIELKRMITALTHGLESYAHGNASPDLAKSILEKKGNLGTDAVNDHQKIRLLTEALEAMPSEESEWEKYKRWADGLRYQTLQRIRRWNNEA